MVTEATVAVLVQSAGLALMAAIDWNVSEVPAPMRGVTPFPEPPAEDLYSTIFEFVSPGMTVGLALQKNAEKLLVSVYWSSVPGRHMRAIATAIPGSWPEDPDTYTSEVFASKALGGR